MATPTLQAINLTAKFSGAETVLKALGEVSFSVEAEEIVCIVGPSGCGKSTLLRLLAGLLPPTSGKVLLDGKELARPTSRIGFVFQWANLMPWRNVERNILLPLELAGTDSRTAVQRVGELVELVGLKGFEKALPRELSGGMAQRVALARSLAHDPEVLLLDEPFANLDALTRDRMGAEVMRIVEARRKTVVLVTHSIPEAILLADRVLVLTSRPGRVREEFAVPQPRPRTLDFMFTPEFGILAAKTRAAIEEAV